MNEAIVKFEGVLERLMADALKEGMKPVEIFEAAFGKAVNRALANGVRPQDIVFECKTCEAQLVGMAIAKSMQNRLVVPPNGAPGLGQRGFPRG